MNPVFCGKCGSKTIEGNAFCSTCGTPLEASVPGQGLPSPGSAPGLEEHAHQLTEQIGAAIGPAQEKLRSFTESIIGGARSATSSGGSVQMKTLVADAGAKIKTVLKTGWLAASLTGISAVLVVFAGSFAIVGAVPDVVDSTAYDQWSSGQASSWTNAAWMANATLTNPVSIRFDLDDIQLSDARGRATAEVPATALTAATFVILALGAGEATRRRRSPTIADALGLTVKISIIFGGLAAALAWFGELANRNGFSGDPATTFRSMTLTALIVTAISTVYATRRTSNATRLSAAFVRGMMGARRTIVAIVFTLLLAVLAATTMVSASLGEPAWAGPAASAVAFPTSIDPALALGLGTSYTFDLDIDTGGSFPEVRTRSASNLSEFPSVTRPGRTGRAPLPMWALTLVPFGAAMLGGIRIGKAKTWGLALMSILALSGVVALFLAALSALSMGSYTFSVSGRRFDTQIFAAVGSNPSAILTRAFLFAFVGGAAGQALLRSRGKGLARSLAYACLVLGSAGPLLAVYQLAPNIETPQVVTDWEDWSSSRSTAAVITDDSEVIGFFRRESGRDAMSKLRNGLTAFKVFYTDAENYRATSEMLEAIEPSLDFISECDSGWSQRPQENGHPR